MARTPDPIWERWDEVDRLLSEALDLDPGERGRLLAERQASDPELASAVRTLLASADEGSEARLSSMARVLHAAVAARDSELRRGPAALSPGQRVGRYTIIDELARGGMATVYLAERADGAFHRRVALKVLRKGLDTEHVVRRFLTERQILSSLSHPNIARLLDGGALEDGRPFLVMERVRGESITAWADHHRATVEERLQLFLQMAGAVQFAHRHLVVHRDLKPSNVLVDTDGQVRLLDFGIAKLLDPTDDEEAGLTRTGAPVPLTPEYASPEQLQGERVTTLSDVFQLGALLYVLLTGRRPFPARGPGRSADQPTRPSETIDEPAEVVVPRKGEDDTEDPKSAAWIARMRGTTPQALRRRLKGDLELIVLKALRREPARRYASVEQMAVDVRRFLQGRPLLARPDSFSYRASRFVGRHPVGMASALVAAVLILASGVVAAVQADRIARERDRVRVEAAKTAQVRDFLTDIFTVSEPDEANGATITARELLDSGAVRVRRELEGQPELQAEMLSTIGRVYARLGMYERARPLLEDAVRLYDAEPVGSATDRIAALRQLALVVWRNDMERGQALYSRALALTEAEYGPESPEVADVLTDFAQRMGSDLDRKTAMMDRAVAILRNAPGDHRAQLASALAVNGYGRGGTDDAVRMQREALAIRRQLYGDHHTEVAASLSDLALTLEATDPVASDSLLAQALAIDLDLLGERHTVTMTVMNNLAGIRRDMGNFEGAEPLYRDVLRLRRAVYPDEWQQAYPLHGLGWVLTELGRAEEAEPYLRESLRWLTAKFPPDHPLVGVAESTLGRCLARQGRFEEAEPLLVGSLQRFSGRLKPGSVNVLRSRVVDLYRDWGRPEEARRFAAEAQPASTGGEP